MGEENVWVVRWLGDVIVTGGGSVGGVSERVSEAGTVVAS